MMFILKYLVIHPIMFIIDWFDYTIDILLVRQKRQHKLRDCPSLDKPHTVAIETSESCIAYRSARYADKLFTIDEPDMNVYKAVRKSASEHPSRPAMGTREIVSVEDQVQSDGKSIKKYIMKNEYAWITYAQMIQKVDYVANGFLNLGLKSNDNVVIFSETRAEWMLCAMACFKIKVPMVTLYATLGLDALVFGIHQTKATTLIASGESVLKLHKIIDKVSQLTQVIVFTDKFTEKHAQDLKKKASHLNVVTFNELEKLGKQSKLLNDYESPRKDDLAVIMYTSGSTGQPKGVMMTHGNLLTSVTSFCNRLGDSKNNAVGIGYLPLAHSLELCAELGWFLGGISIGYSSPFTLIDSSTAIKEGHLGDIRVLRPKLMMGVPIMLERIKKTVEEKMAKQSSLMQTVFQAAYKQKLRNMREGRSSSILDRVLFSKIREALGGQIDAIIVGGSILNKDVHEFAQVCFGTIVQAYGLTETCCATTGQFLNDFNTGHVGGAVECCEIRLVDWPEGNYRVKDKPYPRGEIWVGGQTVTLGYYNMPEKTLEDYRTINGIRFFATGDIGEMNPHGNLIIIDRKKDLVKLQGGEYVSLNKVETVIKLMPLVDNCCVIANPSKPYCICLVTPNLKKAQEFLHLLSAKNQVDNNNNNNKSLQNGSAVKTTTTTTKKSSSETGLEALEEIMNVMDRHESVRKEFVKELLDHCLGRGLSRFEIPAKVKFVKEVWLPDSGLVTDSLKLKRKEIEKFYANEIRAIYT